MQARQRGEAPAGSTGAAVKAAQVAREGKKMKLFGTPPPFL